jgi:site-specific DNA-methyltransferase (adenine-specific)
LETLELDAPRPDSYHNQYHHGDNYSLLQALADHKAKIDLIYIDPPYMTDLDYVSTITVGGYTQNQRINRLAFKDRWEQGLDSFLEMLYPRLKAMYQVLAAHGSIFVHVDWHVSHYVRVLLDEIFGPENFVNEIVWCYGGGNSTRRRFHRKHDLIFWYSRSAEYTYNPQFRPYSTGTLERGLTKVKGDQYKLHGEGALMQDWWTDVGKILSPTAYENLKYPTQKPLALIKRVVEAASNPGNLVADFFCGSGTLAEVANQTGRNWIMSDSSPIALQTCLYRLIRSDSPSFIVTGTSPIPEPGDQKVRIKTELSSDGSGWLLYIDLEEFETVEKFPANHHFSEFIEFWELDLNYDQKVFRSQLQIIRSHRFKEPLATNLQVRLLTDHDFTLAVKVHDVWGHETMATVHIELA